MSQLQSDALVVRTVDVGETDVIATLITEQVGKVSAVVRGARKGSRRVGGALEPIHTIAVLLDDKGGDLLTLKEARITQLRLRVAEDLASLDAAGTALRWARHLFPLRTPEPAGWAVLVELLDALERDGGGARQQLASAGLAMLTAVGYGLELERCAACGRPCPEGKSACVDPVRGGLVCRACGGASDVLSPEARRAARILASGRCAEATSEEADAVLGLVDRAMAAHADFER